MSTVNLGNNIIRANLAFVLESAVSPGFIKKPKQIDGCVLWLDASDSSTLTTEGAGYVRYWSDKSSSNVVATGGGLTLANEPLLISNSLNGLPSIYFDGNDYFEIPNNSALQTQNEKTVFVVYKYTKVSNTNYGVLIQRGSGDATEEIRLAIVNNADWIYFDIGNSGGPYIQPTGQNINIRDYAANIITATATRSAGASTLKLYSNGKDMGGSTINPANTPSIGSFITSIGKQIEGASNTNFFTGFISEIIVYNRCLSDVERNQIHNYLANKWRISLLQATLTNRDLIFNKLATCQNNNIPVVDKTYRLNPANATGSPLQSNFYFADPVSWMNSIITASITLEAWVKPNSFTFFGNSADLGAIMIANSNFYLSLDGNGKFNFYIQGSGGGPASHLPSTTSVTRHAWNHVVITFDGAYVRWYLNGVLDKTSSTTYSVGTITLTNYLGIGSEGASTFGRFLDGYVANCKIYGKALSPAEVSQNYEQTKTEFSNSLSIVSNNIICYYDADIHSSYIGSGTSFVDVSGSGYNATINNAPTFSSSEPKTFILNGTTQDITLPSNFNNGLTSATWEFWVNCASLPSSAVQQLYIQEACVWLALYNTSGVTFFGSDLNNGSGWFDNNGGFNTGARTTSTLSINTWYHVTYSWDGSTIRIYLNGSLESTSSTLQAVNGRQNVTVLGTGTTPRSIGSRSGSYFNGKISMFRNYNIALSTTQVLKNYNATKFRFGK